MDVVVSRGTGCTYLDAGLYMNWKRHIEWRTYDNTHRGEVLTSITLKPPWQATSVTSSSSKIWKGRHLAGREP